MKDIYLTNEDGKFGDIVFEETILTVNDSETAPRKVRVKTLKTIENEPKLLQSIKKLLLTEMTDHPLTFGIERNQFSIDLIVQALTFYNDLTQTTNPLEQIGEIVSIKQLNYTYEIVLKTVAGTKATLTVGV